MIHRYPYTHYNEINLDWILDTVGKLKEAIENLRPDEPIDRRETLKTLFDTIEQPNSGMAFYKSVGEFGYVENPTIERMMEHTNNGNAVCVVIRASDTPHLVDSPADGLLIIAKGVDAYVYLIGDDGFTYTINSTYQWRDIVIDIAHGGTGATTAAGARAAIGAAPENHTHLGTDILTAVPVAKGGTGATTAAGARANLDAAAEDHTHTVNDITGVMPISKGGTGASTAENARVMLGAASADHSHTPDDITEVIPIDKGGTGSTTVDDALTALQAYIGAGAAEGITAYPNKPGIYRVTNATVVFNRLTLSGYDFYGTLICLGSGYTMHFYVTLKGSIYYGNSSDGVREPAQWFKVTSTNA